MIRGFFVAVMCLLTLSAFAPIHSPAETLMKLHIKGKGEVVIELFTKEAPKTTAQIIKLAESGFYNNQKFFRVLKDPRPFLVLFGDPQTKTLPLDDPKIGEGGSGTTVPYEKSGKSNVKGAVGLSTKPRDKNSGDSQFYILLDDKPFLNGTYTVFGQVKSGMDIVTAITVGDLVTSVEIVRG